MVEHTERKLARVVLIDSLHPIEGADRIELAMVGGWQVVVQKGLYVAGDKAVYFEIDSLLPLDYPAFASLSGISSKLQFVVDGKQYARIKTMKLRKQLSQGFCVPLQDAGAVGAPVVLPVDVANAITDADGPSGLKGKYREGFVYKSMTRDFSFKVISNAYLLKEE